MTEKELRAMGGVDLSRLPAGVKILAETTAGVYEITVIDQGKVSVRATVPPFKAESPFVTRLEKSIWDDKGEVFIPFWIGRNMRMVFVDSQGNLFATHSVTSAKVEGKSWSYEVWETTLDSD